MRQGSKSAGASTSARRLRNFRISNVPSTAVQLRIGLPRILMKLGRRNWPWRPAVSLADAPQESFPDILAGKSQCNAA
jgi:hypothetical protein